MTFGGQNYTGWDRWLYPVRLSGPEVVVLESSTGDFGAPDNGAIVGLDPGTYYATHEDHSAQGLPGLGLYEQLESAINGATALSNYYLLTADQPSAYTAAHSLQIERTAGTLDYQIQCTNLDPGWLGQTTATFDDAGSGTISGQVSRFGECPVAASQAADLRGWPARRAARSRKDIAEGRVRQLGARKDRTVRYRRLSAVDVWPSRAEDTTDNPLYDTAAFDRSEVFSAPAADPNVALRHLWRYGGLLDDIIVVWGQDSPTLTVTAHDWETVRWSAPGDFFEVLDDTEEGERYDIALEVIRTGGSWEH